MAAFPRALALACACALAGAAWADIGRDRPAGGPPAAAEQETTGVPDAPTRFDEARARAIERGLAWLAEAQSGNPDGSFPQGQAESWAPVGVTALGALAFMAGGNSPGRGPHGRAAGLALDYLLAHVDLAQGSEEYGYISNQGDVVSRMHGHGFATLALAEAYGMAPRNERLKQALTAAVGIIERSQSTEGGWFYYPRPVEHEGSVTVCLVQALRAARDAGVQVDPAVIARAEDYVLALRNEAGLFRYTLESSKVTVGLTAAGISTLNAAGRYDEAVIRGSVEAIWKGLELRRNGEESAVQRREYELLYSDYERLYLAQAFYHLSDTRDFERWFAEEAESVIKKQERDGSWKSPKYGEAYATAVNVLVLGLPDGLLPIFQR